MYDAEVGSCHSNLIVSALLEAVCRGSQVSQGFSWPHRLVSTHPGQMLLGAASFVSTATTSAGCGAACVGVKKTLPLPTLVNTYPEGTYTI